MSYFVLLGYYTVYFYLHDYQTKNFNKAANFAVAYYLKQNRGIKHCCCFLQWEFEILTPFF